MQVKQTNTLRVRVRTGLCRTLRHFGAETPLDYLFLAILKQEGGHASSAPEIAGRSGKSIR